MRRFRALLGLVLLTPLVVAPALAARSDPAPADASIVVSPFDVYPGFGRSPGAMLRDDTIAFWEAFRREKLVVDCMAATGLQYFADAAFPIDPILQIAESLGVQPVQGGPDPIQQNRDYLASLSSADLDRYYQKLLGESGATIAAFEASDGRVPTGSNSDTFATGGCRGQAQQSIPGIWEARREFEDAFGEQLRGQAAAAASGEYRVCVEAFDVAFRVTGQPVPNAPSNPGFLEEAIAAANPTDAWTTAMKLALNECEPVWAEGYRSAEGSLALVYINCQLGGPFSDPGGPIHIDAECAPEGNETFAQARAQYANATTTIAADAAFLQYLALAAGRATTAIATE